VIDAAAFFVYEIRDRRIVRDRAFRSRDEALEAVGLSEQAMSDESLEIVRRSIDAFNWGDLEGVLEKNAPEFEMRPSGRFGARPR
jgi:hypothetical protein